MEVKNEAKVGEMQLSIYPFRGDQIRLATYSWGQSDKKVLLLHGWGGSPLDFKHMITALVSSGYEVISFDAPAHGFSAGKRTNLIQWMHVMHQVLQQAGPVHAIIGHSLGGLNAALTLVRQEVTVPRLVMISAAVSAPSFFKETYDLFRIPPVVVEKVEQQILKQLHQDLKELDLFLYPQQIKAEKILVVYDENDTVAKPEEINMFLQQYSSISALRINGDGHFRIMKDKVVIEKVLDFLN